MSQTLSKNLFSHCENLIDLDAQFEYLCEPEILYCDGEATQAEVQQKLRTMKRDYTARREAIIKRG